MIPLWWCRVSVAGLIVLQPVWFAGVNSPVHVPVTLVLAITMVPLLAVLPGVWQLRPRALVIAGCVLLLYFSFAVMEAWAQPAARWPALVQIFLIGLFFIALPSVRKVPDRTG